MNRRSRTDPFPVAPPPVTAGRVPMYKMGGGDTDNPYHYTVTEPSKTCLSEAVPQFNPCCKDTHKHRGGKHPTADIRRVMSGLFTVTVL